MKVIIERATELFLQLGFKSVTMDYLAEQMGISKKTLYVHFENKEKLIEASTCYLFETVCSKVEKIRETSATPIEAFYETKNLLLQYLGNEQTSPNYQLQKYYCKIHLDLKEKESAVFLESISSSLAKGIEMGLFRKEIALNIASRLYLNGIRGVKDISLFSLDKFRIGDVLDNFLEYYLRGIVTPKGLEKLNEIKLKMK